MSLLITICARGGSKGIPGKNIKPLNDIPLIAYTIEIAKKFASRFNGAVAISSDDKDILEVAGKFGLDTDYIRPLELASDAAGKIDTIADLLRYEESKSRIKYDYILDLDVTSPLRTYEDLCDAFELLKNDESAINLFSVNDAARNPYFNMVEKKENGYYHLVKPLGDVLTRQSAPKVYDLNASFYFYKRVFFEQELKTVFTEKSLIYTMPHLCFDLDHNSDFEFLQYLLANNKLEFQIW